MLVSRSALSAGKEPCCIAHPKLPGALLLMSALLLMGALLLMTFEGWQFRMEIKDRGEEI
jgi:hypothetical protein